MARCPLDDAGVPSGGWFGRKITIASIPTAAAPSQ